MISLDTDRLIAAASAFIGVGEAGADNHGQMVEFFLAEVGCQPGDPWCAAFVAHVGHWSHYDPFTKRSSWPLPRTAACSVLGDYAQARGLLVSEPAPGDLFLCYSPERRRFHHTGIVLAVARPTTLDGITCTTIEGNTNNDGSANGRTTLVRERILTPDAGDRFVRWTGANTATAVQ